jgi:hypothetical protein
MVCPICLIDPKGKFQIKFLCKHVLCLSCFLKLKKDSCPMCRSKFIDKLPNYLREYFTAIIGEVQQPRRSAPNIGDEYEFPPL